MPQDTRQHSFIRTKTLGIIPLGSGFISPFYIFQPLEKQWVGNTCETASSKNLKEDLG